MRKLNLTKLQYLWVVLLLIAFLFLRLYQLDKTLYFFGDMGRDFVELQKIVMDKDIPLLGPQTSAFAFNQSPMYYYLLLPLYVLTGHSLYSAVWTSLLVHVFIFGSGVWYLQKDRRLLWVWLVAWTLVTFHPEFVVQQRFIWNPSFVGATLLVGVVGMLKYIDKEKRLDLWLFAGGIATAVALNYAVMPVAATIFLAFFVLIKNLRKSLMALGATIASGIVLYLPTLAFEVRHSFFLTKLLFTGEKLQQAGGGAFSELPKLLNLTFGSMWLWLAVLLLLEVVINLWKVRTNKKYAVTALLGATLILAFAAMTATGIQMHSHYVFGVAVLLFVFVGLLPTRASLVVTVILLFAWLQPTWVNRYFAPARRSVEATVACGQQICAQLHEPTFVTLHSASHDHRALEFRYLLRENGCDVKDLDTQRNQASALVVVADDATFEFGKTAFNELTQFGASTESAQIDCSQNLRAHILH